MFCTKCGMPLVDGAKFCTGCGAPVGVRISVNVSQDTLYQAAVKKMEQRTQQSLRQAAEEFQKLSGFKDAEAMAAQCLEQAENMRRDEIYDRASERMHADPPTQQSLRQAAEEFQKLGGYRDAEAMAAQCLEQAENMRRDEIYDRAAAQLRGAQSSQDCRQALEALEPIDGWRDVSELLVSGRQKLEELTAKEQAERAAAARKRRRILCAAGLCAVVLVAGFFTVRAILRAGAYRSASAALDSGDYAAAVDGFGGLGGYKDSAEQLQRAQYLQADDDFQAQQYDIAYDGFAALGDYEDSAERARQALYYHGQSLYNMGSYERAMDIFEQLGDYEDSAEHYRASAYESAKNWYYDGDNERAEAVFRQMRDYEQSGYYLTEIEMDAIRYAGVGATVTFGVYEQDGDLSNGPEPITWRTIRDQDGEALMLISEYGLDCLPYNDYAGNIQWADSSLRAWLNDEFLNSAFNEDERSYMGQIVGTGDNVFVLYNNEAEDFFYSYADRAAEPTPYAASKGGTGNWWLASNGLNAMSDAAYVNVNGRVETWGDRMDRTDYCVRPAIWVYYS